MNKIVLASASPRRREILNNIGLKFEVVVSDADESKIDKNSVPVGVYVQELALLKATATAERLADKRAIIISADTIVCSEGEILGKPKDEDDAKRMLRELSGKEHSVFTGICVMKTKNAFSVCSSVETKVKFKELSDEVIESYVKTGEPLDKAGAYGIQGKGALLVEKIDGDYLNVVGLPVGRLAEILKNEFEIDLFEGEL